MQVAIHVNPYNGLGSLNDYLGQGYKVVSVTAYRPAVSCAIHDEALQGYMLVIIEKEDTP